MDKRRAWRDEEQRLVERWNAATARYQEAQAELTHSSAADGTGASGEERLQKVEAARAELEIMRKQVARMKVEFSNGKRY